MWIPEDFVAIDMEEDDRISIILGKQFLTTYGALINVKNGKISLNIGNEKVVFDMKNSMKYPVEGNRACSSEEGTITTDELASDNEMDC